MYITRLIAVITEKRNKDISVKLEVARMDYKIEHNVLWITDIRGYCMDFDLDEFDVEIKTISQEE